MTNWYAYRWVCDNCRAVHYYDPGPCRRCGCKRLTKSVNNQKLVDELKTDKRKRKPVGPTEVERETKDGPRIPEEPAHPIEEDDDVLGESGGKKVQQSEAPSDNDPLDDLINDILDG